MSKLYSISVTNAVDTQVSSRVRPSVSKPGVVRTALLRYFSIVGAEHHGLTSQEIALLAQHVPHGLPGVAEARHALGYAATTHAWGASILNRVQAMTPGQVLAAIDAIELAQNLVLANNTVTILGTQK